uniref:Zinc knuckle CX2CX4HX4C n=1 Tax=Tanacetum cinerariifolium TaxID=118510 RepID=A0A699H537_TANCI|nr:zinc knuckle CX2CX4HX4C [Tanacetum cinerariifolium]
MNPPKDVFDNIDGKIGNGGTKPVSFASIFMDNTPKKMIKLFELNNEERVEGAVVVIPLAAIDEPPRCDTCKIFDHISDQCSKKVKVVSPTQESDDGFVKVTRKHGKEEQNGKPRHIDGVRLTKPQLNYFYRAVSKPASTSQPKYNKETASQSNVCSTLEEDNGNPMDGLVDETRKKVEVHYFDMDDMKFDDMGHATEGWEHENTYNDNG